MMRGCLAVLVFLAAVPMVSGQQVVAEDTSGDAASVAGPGLPDLFGVDLTQLRVTETEADFSFQVDVSAAPSLPGALYEVHFVFGSVEYRAIVRSLINLNSGGGNGNSLESRLERLESSGDWLDLGYVGGVWQEPQVLSIAVSRSLILSSSGATPGTGDVLDAFWATAFSNLDSSGGPSRVVDRMPDADVSATRYDVVYGLQQTGAAYLLSPDAYRLTNGEEASYLYTVTAGNNGTSAMQAQLVATNVPQGWKVTVLQEEFTIPAGSNVTVPVLVHVPFFHQHGARSSVLLELHDVNDAGSIGRVRVGVLYTEIPQPAGHHPGLYIHTGQISTADPVTNAAFQVSSITSGGDPGTYVYLNTLNEDSAAVPVRVAAFGDPAGIGMQLVGAKPTYNWNVVLRPAWGLGLDFDLARTGLLRVPIHFELPLSKAILSGQLVLEGPEDADGNPSVIPLADLQPTTPVAASPNSEVTFESVIVPVASADRIDYLPGYGMVLHLHLVSDEQSTYQELGYRNPGIVPGGSMDLPLLEYRRPVDAGLQAPGYSFDEPAPEVRVAAGGFQVLNVSLTIPGGSSHKLVVLGPEASWLRLPTPAQLDGTGSVPFQVGVEPPSDAVNDGLAYVVVKSDKGEIRAILGITMRLDAGAASVAKPAELTKDAAVPFAVPILAVLAAFLAARRFR